MKQDPTEVDYYYLDASLPLQICYTKSGTAGFTFISSKAELSLLYPVLILINYAAL